MVLTTCCIHQIKAHTKIKLYKIEINPPRWFCPQFSCSPLSQTASGNVLFCPGGEVLKEQPAAATWDTWQHTYYGGPVSQTSVHHCAVGTDAADWRREEGTMLRTTQNQNLYQYAAHASHAERQWFKRQQHRQGWVASRWGQAPCVCVCVCA